MEADPYDGYVELFERLLRNALESVNGMEQDGELEVAAEEAVFNIEGSLYEVAGNTWRARAEIESGIGLREKVDFRSLDSMIRFVYATSILLEREGSLVARRPPDIVRYVIAALGVKAVSVGHEICAMLRAGFPVGAHARWRTLYEVDVIAHVLSREIAVPPQDSSTIVGCRWFATIRELRPNGQIRSRILTQ